MCQSTETNEGTVLLAFVVFGGLFFEFVRLIFAWFS